VKTELHSSKPRFDFVVTGTIEFEVRVIKRMSGPEKAVNEDIVGSPFRGYNEATPAG
jgi:hypothetical protein